MVGTTTFKGKKKHLHAKIYCATIIARNIISSSTTVVVQYRIGLCCDNDVHWIRYYDKNPTHDLVSRHNNNEITQNVLPYCLGCGGVCDYMYERCDTIQGMVP